MRLGMLTPSSNTVLEPTTAAMLAATPGITAHFARLRVLGIALGEAATAQFDPAAMVAAAELLADARVDAICWNGTSGAWLGPAADRAIAEAVTAATAIPATTATLALFAALRLAGARRVALVTPYLATVQAAILATLAAEGFDTVAERHLDDPGNFSFALHEETHIAALLRETAAAQPDAIIVHCTNFRGTRLAPTIEAETGTLVLDSIALALWGALRAARGDPRRIRGWGRLFVLGT